MNNGDFPLLRKTGHSTAAAILTRYGLELVTKKKGLSIQGDELQLRFLVIDILHPLFEFTSENKVLARFANTPLEKQTYELATEYLSCSFQEATEILSRFLSETGWSLNYPSKNSCCFLSVL